MFREVMAEKVASDQGISPADVTVREQSVSSGLYDVIATYTNGGFVWLASAIFVGSSLVPVSGVAYTRL